MERHMKLHVLHAGYIRVSREVPFGDRTDLKTVGKMLAAPDRERVTLPVCCYLLEHPRGPVLIDTEWGREISPNGVYDPAAVSRCLPQRLAAFYRPWVPAGMTVREQLIARGLGPEDLKCIPDASRPRPCGRAALSARGTESGVAGGRVFLVLPHGV